MFVVAELYMQSDLCSGQVAAAYVFDASKRQMTCALHDYFTHITTQHPATHAMHTHTPHDSYA